MAGRGGLRVQVHGRGQLADGSIHVALPAEKECQRFARRSVPGRGRHGPLERLAGGTEVIARGGRARRDCPARRWRA